MLFHKKISPDNPPIPNNGVHPWLWSGLENKNRISKYLDQLLCTDFIHTSKVGIVNRMTKSDPLVSERDKAKIQALYENGEIDMRLKNFFDSLSIAEYALSNKDEKTIEDLCKSGKISVELRDACYALFGSRELIPDLMASQIQKLYEKEFLNEKAFNTQGLKCCRDLIFNLGYRDVLICNTITSQDDGLRTIVNEPDVTNLMIIPGCQHDGMLSGRVLKAVRILNNFNNNLTIYASGGNPLKNPTGPEYVNIAEESKSIHNFFDEMVETLNVKLPPDFNIIPELESYDSDSNLENCLKSLEDKPYNIIIVSSTFHLIKLAKSLERILSKKFERETESTNNIRNIILVGAEGIDANFKASKSGGYIKSMFVAVFTELLAYKETLKRKESLKRELDINGYKYIRKDTPVKLHELINFLGDIQQAKDITVQEKPKKDSDSARAMDLHTDHPSTDYVILECIKPSSKGGVSYISDMLAVYQGLRRWEKESVAEIQLKNVIRNKTDKPFHSVVTEKDGQLYFYFVPWLVRDQENQENRSLVEDVSKKLVEQQEEIELKEGDILIIDNKRMAHGRSEISGDKDRLLRRYSIKSTAR